MGYWRRFDIGRADSINERGMDSEEAYMAGYERGYAEAMMRSRHEDMGMRTQRTQYRGYDMRDEDPYGNDDMGERRYRRRADGRFM